MRLEFTATAQKDLRKLGIITQKRIIKKLRFFMDQDDPLRFAASLTDFRNGGDYRFRIGDYRVVFDLDDDAIFVLHIEHRREVYRR